MPEAKGFRITYTRMRVRGNKLVIGIGSCHECHGLSTVIPTWEEDCRTCSGKGFIRYARFDRVCHKCKGSCKRQVWGENDVTCPRCKGVNSKRFEKGQRSDAVHPRIVEHIPSKVYRLSFEPTRTQEGTLNVMSTCYDYGRARKLHTANLLKSERPYGASASQISREDGTLCLHFGIFVTPKTRYVGVVFDENDLAWIAEGNRAARKAAAIRRREAKKCCPTCKRPFTATA